MDIDLNELGPDQTLHKTYFRSRGGEYNTPCMEKITPTVARRVAVANALTSINMKIDWAASRGHAEMDSARVILGTRPAERAAGQRKMQWRRCKSNDRIIKITPSDFKLNMLRVRNTQQ
jgi:hypothetical protein